MKRGKLITMAACCAALLAAGCSTDGGDGWREGVPIEFAGVTVADASTRSAEPGQGAATRAGLETASVFDAGVFFPGPAYGGTEFNNRKYTTNGAGGMSPSNGSPVYWQNANQLEVIAYAPYNNTWTSLNNDHTFNVTADQHSNGGAGLTASDLLWGQTAGVAFGNAVALRFAHKMSKLKITLLPDLASITQAEWDAAGSKSVKVVNTLPTATFDLVLGNPGAASGTATAITPHYSATDTYEAIIVPQTVAVGKALLEVTVGARTFVYSLPSVQTFTSGNEYAYPVKVSRTGITVGAPTIGEWGGNTDSPTPGKTASTYKVGDYYPDPDANLGDPAAVAAIQGVVYWLDAQAPGYNAVTKKGVSGKVVSLDQPATALAWNTAALNDRVRIGTTNSDGQRNMKAMADYIADNSVGAGWSDFPIFEWVHTIKNSGTGVYDGSVAGMWYVPAWNELKELHDVWNSDKTTFDGWLTAAGGTPIDTGFPFYWSSTEDGAKYALDVNFANGTGGYGAAKNSTANVRAIMAF